MVATVPTARLLVAALAMLALAGCIGGGPPDDPASPSAVPVADQPGVDDPMNVTVRVVDPTGGTRDPVAGARVVFFTKVADNVYDPGYFTDVDECRSVDRAPFAVLASATTNAEGRVRGRVRPGAVDPVHDVDLPVYVAVDGPPGYTSEAYVKDLGMSLPCDFSGIQRTRLVEDERQRVTAPIYPTTVAFEAEGALGAQAAAWTERAGARRVWAPHAIYSDRAHLRRLVEVEAWLTWSNGGGDWADLHLGIGEAGEAGPCHTGPDARQGPRDRHNVELLHPRHVPCGFHEEARVGPVGDRPVVTPDAVPYRVTGNLTFAGTEIQIPTS